MQKMSLLVFSKIHNQFPHWKGDLNPWFVLKKTKDQLMIQDLVGENKVVIDRISKLTKTLDILQNKMTNYNKLQRLHKLLEMRVIYENANLINN